jgi:hypothetical protein
VPATVRNRSPEELRWELEFLVENIPVDSPPALVDAMRGVLAGIDYRDPALVGSHWQALREAIADTADSEIEKHLRWAQLVRQFGETVRTLDGVPGEEFDRLGRTLETVFDKLTGSMSRLKVRWVELARECGMEVSRAAELESARADLVALRQEILGTWPWSANELPPVDRGMVERSRAAVARGEGEPIEDVIRRVAGHPTKG